MRMVNFQTIIIQQHIRFPLATAINLLSTSPSPATEKLMT